jgi:hypothetical protein
MVRPLEYGSNIAYGEAVERFSEVQREFERIKGKYSGFFSRFRSEIAPEDLRSLTDCVGVLLPLGLEKCIQDASSGPSPTQIGEMTEQIIAYAAKFRNSGVTTVGNVRSL